MSKKQVAILGVLSSVAACVFIGLCFGIVLLTQSPKQESVQAAPPKAVQVNEVAEPTVVLPPVQEPTPTNTKVVANTPTMASDAPHGVYGDIESLVEGVVGSRLQSLSVTYWAEDGEFYENLQSVPANSGMIGYDVDLSVTAANTRTRSEMLQIAYALAYEFYYNFADKQPGYLILHLRSDEDDSNCVFGLGIGYRATAKYLPAGPAPDLETWFGSLVTSKYYGDLPGQSDDLLAYGNDPTSKPFCRLEGWKK